MVNNNKYLEELQEILEKNNIKWDDNYLNIKDFTPPFEEYSDDIKWFYLILGKFIKNEELNNKISQYLHKIDLFIQKNNLKLDQDTDILSEALYWKKEFCKTFDLKFKNN